MARNVTLLIGFHGENRVTGEGKTIAELLRSVLSCHPELSGELNDNDATLLIGRFRRVFLNDELAWWYGCGARWDDGQPVGSSYPSLPDEICIGLNAPLKDQDTIHVFKAIA